jgi:glycosyltransferase involved in cell wall biosynthesis
VRIIHINTSDCMGGAARSAYRLHDGLKRLGEDSRMFVAHRFSHDPAVVQFTPSSKPMKWLLRAARRVRINRDAYRERESPVASWSMISDDRTMYASEPWNQCPQADLFQLHWISGFLDYGAFFRWLPKGAPVVWTLHDMNPLTGGCHYDAGCGRYANECGSCPQLGSGKEEDLSRAIIRRKRRSFEALSSDRLHIVTPSRWLGEQAEKSSLFSRFHRSVIPYGLDTDVFRPRAKRAIREILDIPINASVVLFIANGVNDPRKGLDCLVRALESGGSQNEFLVLTLGPGQPVELRKFPHIHIQATQDDGLLSCIYSAADVFVAPSLQDNLPNTVLESLACGTPVVAFRAGGIPEAVRHGETGLLASVGDLRELRDGIFELLADEGNRAAMGRRCRTVALEEYALETQARRYLSLYEALASKEAYHSEETGRLANEPRSIILRN